MEIDILTKEDLNRFKKEILEEIGKLLNNRTSEIDGEREWLRSRDVRRKLDISPGTLQNLRIKGALPYRKVGGTMFYRLSDVRDMMEGGNKNG